MTVPFHGQTTVVAAQPTQLTSLAIECKGFTIKASLSNTGTVYLGSSTVASLGGPGVGGYFLDPGETFEYQRNVSITGPPYVLSPQDFYVIGTDNDVVSWLASP